MELLLVRTGRDKSPLVKPRRMGQVPFYRRTAVPASGDAPRPVNAS